jgi:hypothetical protein
MQQRQTAVRPQISEAMAFSDHSGGHKKLATTLVDVSSISP